MTAQQRKAEALRAVTATREAVEKVRADYHDEDRYQEPGSWQKALGAAKATRDAAVIAYGQACVSEALAPREPSPELVEAEAELRRQADDPYASPPYRNRRIVVLDELDRLRAEIARLGGEASRSICTDCRCEVLAGPTLCEDCHRRRMAEGMDCEDARTIEEWRKS